jgi:hypothetical protein
MDAYLLKEAFQTLSALSLLPPDARSDGLLIGHKRGHRFFVEKILPTQKGFFSSLDKYFALNRLYDDRLLGFFSFQPDEKTMKKILVPFAFGKLLLKIRLDGQKDMSIEPFVVEFEKKFYLSPIPLRSSR